MSLGWGHPGGSSLILVCGVNKSNLNISVEWMVGQVLSEVDLNSLTKIWVWCRNSMLSFLPVGFSDLSSLNSMDINSNSIKPDGVRKIFSLGIDPMGSDTLKSLVWEVNDEVKTQMVGPSHVDVSVGAYVNGVTHWTQLCC